MEKQGRKGGGSSQEPSLLLVRPMASEVGPWLLSPKLLDRILPGQVRRVWLLAFSPYLPARP